MCPAGNALECTTLKVFCMYTAGYVLYCTTIKVFCLYPSGYVLYCTTIKVFCMCPAGYVLGPDWKQCEDVNECETNNNDCPQLCINVPGINKRTTFLAKKLGICTFIINLTLSMTKSERDVK